MSLLQTVKLFGRVLSLFLPVRIIPRELEVRHIRSPLRNPRRPIPEIWSVVSCDRDRKKIWILHGPSARIFGSVVFPVCKSANPSDSCYCEITPRIGWHRQGVVKLNPPHKIVRETVKKVRKWLKIDEIRSISEIAQWNFSKRHRKKREVQGRPSCAEKFPRDSARFQSVWVKEIQLGSRSTVPVYCGERKQRRYGTCECL